MPHVKINESGSFVRVRIVPESPVFSFEAQTMPVDGFPVAYSYGCWYFDRCDRWKIDFLIYKAFGLDFTGDGLEDIKALMGGFSKEADHVKCA